ncbi:MAG: glycine cleavage system protein GcvH [Candidatus Nanopelagicales bacterium]
MRFTPEHDWLLVEDGVVVVGITAHAAELLGDVVYVELPEVGSEVAAGDEVVVIESVKTASDILAPLPGRVVAVNSLLADAPELVNEDPFGAAWFFKLEVADLAALDGFLDEAAYQASIA